jgi:vesicle-associated membrane protein 4
MAEERAALLDRDSEDEDDFFLHGPSVSTAGIRGQLDDVANLARENVNKLTEREERLDALEERSVRLDDAASNFRAGTVQFRRKAWWQQAKYKAVGASGLGILLFLLIIIIIASRDG